MAQTKTRTDEYYQVFGEWLNELRTELKDIRNKCDQMDGIDPVKLKLQSLETEAMLVECFGSVLAGHMGTLSKL